MYVNFDMHWRHHERLYERIEYDVDVKVDNIVEKHGHEHVQKLL